MNGDIPVNGWKMVALLRVNFLQTHHRAGAPWIHNHCWDVLLRLIIGHPPEQDGMRTARVMSPEADHVRPLNIVVTSRRRVGS